MRITFSICIKNSSITLKSMERGSLCRVLDWYNAGEGYRYATGTDRGITQESLEEKFDDIAVNEKEFFLGIYRSSDVRLVGIMIGSLSGSVVWIKLLTIAVEQRGRGLGSSSAGLLLRHMKEAGHATDCLLSVVDKNTGGRRFWTKNGFREISRLEKHKLFNGEEYGIIIMHKSI